MNQPFDKVLMFKNRLNKVFKHLSKVARKQEVSCYRLYDHDLPEFPFLIELYGDKVYVSEYKRRFTLTEEQHEEWLRQCKNVIAEVTGAGLQNIYVKLRQRKAGRLGQYQKLNQEKTECTVEENGLRFLINLSDYLDTGLFLDHRITRQMVKQLSINKKVLNLFCYTGSFSVYAAAGNAFEIVSVDLSKTYLDWAQRNVQLNFPGFKNHQLIQADVMLYLKQVPMERFDLIVLDPPTFSNSKRMDDYLDIQRDHVALINNCMHILKTGGLLFFSTNFIRFVLDVENIKAGSIRDVTKATTPFDFTGKLHRQCFILSK